MKTLKSFSTGLIALLITAMLLVACGDSPTATKAPAPTTAAATTAAAPTTAAVTTVAPTTATVTTAAPTTTAAATTAVATTVAPTTAAATTAAPTTAAVAGALPVPTGTRPLKFSPGVTKTLIGQFATGAGTTNVAFESYTSGQNPVDLSKFFDQKLVEQGYTSHPETQASQQQGNVNFLSASFTKTNAAGKAEVTSIALVGPLDAAVINEIAGFETASTVNPDTDVTRQLKAGDTLIMSFTFAAPGGVGAAPTTPAATVAANGTFPTPAGTRVLKLSAEADKVLFGTFGTTGTTTMTGVKISTYVVSGRADKVSMYYDQAMTTLGYAAHPETNTGDVKGNVSFITQNYTKGTLDTFVIFVGPLDVPTISAMAAELKKAGLSDDIISQLIIGDTIIRAYEGTQPAAAVTTTVAATKAPVASSPIPLPSGAKVLNLSDSLKVIFDGEFGDEVKNGKLTAYVINDDLDSLTGFFEKQLPGLGYTLIPASQSKSEQDGVNILTAGFAKGNDAVLVALFGPMDEATINDMANADLNNNPATSIKSQVKVGDTVIFVISGTAK